MLAGTTGTLRMVSCRTRTLVSENTIAHYSGMWKATSGALVARRALVGRVLLQTAQAQPFLGSDGSASIGVLRIAVDGLVWSSADVAIHDHTIRGRTIAMSYGGDRTRTGMGNRGRNRGSRFVG